MFNLDPILDHTADERETEIREAGMISLYGYGWQAIADEHTDRFVSADDFPIYDASADEDLPTVEDWEAFAEMTFTEFPRY